MMQLCVMACFAISVGAGGVNDSLVVNATVEVVHVHDDPEIVPLPHADAVSETVYIESGQAGHDTVYGDADRLPDSEDTQRAPMAHEMQDMEPDPLTERVEHVESEIKGLNQLTIEHMSKELDGLTARVNAAENDARSAWVDGKTEHEAISDKMETLVRHINEMDARLTEIEMELKGRPQSLPVVTEMAS